MAIPDTLRPALSAYELVGRREDGRRRCVGCGDLHDPWIHGDFDHGRYCSAACCPPDLRRQPPKVLAPLPPKAVPDRKATRKRAPVALFKPRAGPKPAPVPLPRPQPQAPREYACECEVCGLSFKARSRRAKTCSDRCRKELHEQRHAPPPRLAAPGEKSCAYCGAPATDREHVFPRAYIQRMQAEGTIISQVIVPSCRECNSLASDRVFPSKAAKARYIGARIAERHASLLATPDWAPKEIAELGYTLRMAVKATLAQRDAVRARLAWNGRTFPRVQRADPRG